MNQYSMHQTSNQCKIQQSRDTDISVVKNILAMDKHDDLALTQPNTLFDQITLAIEHELGDMCELQSLFYAINSNRFNQTYKKNIHLWRV